MRNTIDECIENFGPAPRRLSLWDRLTYLRIPRPRWLPANSPDGLNTLFGNLQTLFTEGTVVWGHVIQANFARKHLPQRRLCTSLLPIVVNPQEPYVAMPLPARYWPEPLID